MQRLFFRWVAHAVDSHGRSAVCHNSVSPLIAALRLSYVSTGWRTTAAVEQTTSGIAFEFWSLCDHFAGLYPEKVVEIKTMFTTKLIKAKKKVHWSPGWRTDISKKDLIISQKLLEFHIYMTTCAFLVFQSVRVCINGCISALIQLCFHRQNTVTCSVMEGGGKGGLLRILDSSLARTLRWKGT